MPRSSGRIRNRRDVSTTIAKTRVLPVTVSPPRSTLQFDLFPLSDVEDRRTYHPEGSFAPARSFSKPRHRLVAVDRRPKKNQVFSHFGSRGISGTKAIIAFKAPDKVLVCVRRSIRKQVLHALNKSGRRGQRKPRFNYYSSVSCRR